MSQSPVQETTLPSAPVAFPSEDRAHELMTQLAAVGLEQNGITPEDALLLKQNLEELARQDMTALPAIREYLARHVDVDFRSAGVAQIVGVSSLRQGLLDILRDIPGPESEEIAAETLSMSPFPEEIAKLSDMLERRAPGVYRQESVAAASDALALAASGQLTGQKISPAFEILQTYGDAAVIPDLENALNTRWRQNAALALAELPDGIGIPALVQFAQDPTSVEHGRGDVALRPLAQVSVRYPEAFEALLEQARDSKIPETAWPTVVSALCGNDYISNGRVLQATRSMSTDLNALNTQRLALLDQLATVVSSPAASQLLAERRSMLASRLRQ